MPETRFESFVHLVDVGPERALVAWGGFWFRRDAPAGRWRVVEDELLDEVDPGRIDSIGARSAPYGAALVEVLDDSGDVVAAARTDTANHTWVEGLRPDTGYRYRITVDGRPWAAGERWDWGPVPRGGLDLRPGGRSYDLRFRTHPAPDARVSLDFVVLGDYGVGIVVDSESARRQRRVARVLERLVDRSGVRLVVGTGDNVYQGQVDRVDGESGGHDDDWYSSFYQPYRYALARVPFYPAVGNHDTSDSETADDREEVRDNFFTDLRFTPAAAGERASVEPGMFYRFRFGADVEFVCLDTSLADSLPNRHFFESPEHQGFLDRAFPADDAGGPTWRFPFSHHPTYCAGPHHPNTASMVDKLVPLFRRSGVRAVFAGHEHNFQVSRADGIDYFLSGAGGQLREEAPRDFEAAHTVAWAAQSHLLLAAVGGDTLTVTPYAALGADGEPEAMTALGPDNRVVEVPFVVSAS
ncbi:Calcineurin-like phosphoesterase [Blastococcus sp. DSM 46786]|uniref:metallophosphoesterase n=1 Tax=Blastococcus sp. DSM 46786 TaxID=1798227 RepID=UPI0008B1E6DD|nr:metallophosphoesterase [Blastococcus sp. DSM 46786]SEL95284.1 Calcineurin-like phosphoesterase [Blastococcus sp. DSM 46786]